ncbi:MAG: di-heme oxidoredictase family protein, partial [Nannocystaceae bacterium]
MASNNRVPLQSFILLALAPGLAACPSDDPAPEPEVADVFAERLGEPVPYATAEQRETFERGHAVALQRFSPEEGLGPTMNVSFCGSCHERPVIGGSAPRYRDFYLNGTSLADGTFIPGGKGGVLTSYGLSGADTRPALSADANVLTHRNPIPFFGVGPIAEIDEASILANEDPDDADGDGISGRANYDRGFVGRFGRKAQTVSIEGFIRGPLNNHLGITSDPLTEEQKARLPIDSSSASVDDGFRQAAAPDEPLVDDDDVPDPELTPDELFDLVSFSMLLAPPLPDAEPSEAALRGAELFEQIDCSGCHVRGLVGPRGLVPLYSDLLLHDMGPELDDGIVQQLASGSEFRTAPLWGIVAAAPYLHDGRADTLDQAIVWHGGEAHASREAYQALSDDERGDVIAFLESLGGREQVTPGLMPPDEPIPEPGVPGAPLPLADEAQTARWLAGRALFENDFAIDRGLGPIFNGDSCRACHFDPMDDEHRTIGGSGPIDVNVMRHGTLDGDGNFSAPAYGTVLHKLSVFDVPRREQTAEHNMFESRQTPTLLGVGLLASVAADDIIALADPDDLDGDGIRGIP